MSKYDIPLKSSQNIQVKERMKLRLVGANLGLYMYIYKLFLMGGLRIWFGFSNTTLNAWHSGYRSTFS